MSLPISALENRLNEIDQHAQGLLAVVINRQAFDLGDLPKLESEVQNIWKQVLEKNKPSQKLIKKLSDVSDSLSNVRQIMISYGTNPHGMDD